MIDWKQVWSVAFGGAIGFFIGIGVILALASL